MQILNRDPKYFGIWDFSLTLLGFADKIKWKSLRKSDPELGKEDVRSAMPADIGKK